MHASTPTQISIILLLPSPYKTSLFRDDLINSATNKIKLYGVLMRWLFIISVLIKSGIG